MEDRLIMRKKELERKTFLEAHRCGKLSLSDAAKRLNISYRQAKRIWKRYVEEKDVGLCHKSRGKKPQNAYSLEFRETILAKYRSKYLDFGPTFAAEKLLEDDNLTVNAETLRLWLKAEGLWCRKRKRQVYRERRERKPGFGDLLQIDGSIHAWFDGDDNHYCLLNMVDDATGMCMALLDKGETTQILLTVLLKWIRAYGVPKAVYVDLKSVYVSPKRMKEKFDDDLVVQEGFSVFEQVCKRLDIAIIRAYSPQAKGRVERKHAVFQDRFVKELKLYGIKTLDAGNNYLEPFLLKINTKFAKPKDSVPDTHRAADLYGDLEQIICWWYKRQLRNDWTILFNREYYQIQKGYEQLLKPETFIVIKKYLNGTLRFWYLEKELLYDKLSLKPEPPSRSKKYHQTKGPQDSLLLSKRATENKHKSPWSKYNQNWLKT